MVKLRSHNWGKRFVAGFGVFIGVFIVSGLVRGADATTEPAEAEPARPVFDIPKLSGIMIDGDGADWGNRGLVVSVMHAGAARRVSADQLNAQLRLGWDDRGLLLLAEVTDPNIHEGQTMVELGNGASIDIGVGDAIGGKEHWVATIAPGMDGEHPKLRTHFTDFRTKANRAVKMSVTAASRKTEDGYVVEALLPWDVLGVHAEIGREIALQVQVNQGDTEQIQHLVWYPAVSFPDTKMMQKVKLSNDASAEIAEAADVGFDRLRHTRFTVAATKDETGAIAQFMMGNLILGQTRLKADGGLATGEISLPMPEYGQPWKPVTVWLDRRMIDTLKIPNADDARKGAGADLVVVANPSVFTDRGFPNVDFENSSLAEDALGDYQIHTTFYDADYNAVSSAEKVGRYGAVVEVTPEYGKSFKRYLTLFRAQRDFDLRPLEIKAGLDLPAKVGVDAAVAKEQMTATGDFIVDEMRNSRRRDSDLAILLAGLNETAAGAGDLPRRLGPIGKNTAWWYGLKKKTGDLIPYKYLVHVPDVKAGEKYPLMLFLHGSGQRGDKLDVVNDNGPPKILKNEPDWQFKNDFIVVSPQCAAGEYWNPLMLRDLLDEVMAKYPVDPDRVYLTGLSMGGFGTWDLAQWFPERFAAIVPICGGGDPRDVARLRDLPVWVFQGGLDDVVDPQCAQEMVAALREIGGRVRFTVYREYGHNSWEPAYDDARLYEWMLEQKRGEPKQERAAGAGTQPDEELREGD